MSLALLSDTIVALSTAQGKSALAIVRVSGSDAIRFVSETVSSPESLWAAPSGSFRYCNVVDEARSLLDDVIVGVFRAPSSYTGEDICEISTHGNPSIVQALIALLCRIGCRLAEPGEFTRRALLNGKLGIEEAELILAKAESVSVADLRGRELAIHEKFEQLRKLYFVLIDLNAQIDAQIDFGESDDIVLEGFDESVASVISLISRLRQSASNRIANAGFLTVVFAGPPNVGKSSLFNALLEYERSVVSQTPGTTRDYIEAFFDLDGYRIKLIDTAGMRDTTEEIEGKGIVLGQTVSRSADLLIRVTDPSNRAVAAFSSETVVHNKQDLNGWSSGLSVSARTGFGLASLVSLIKETAVSQTAEISQKVVSESELMVLDVVLQKLLKVNLQMEPILLSEDLRFCIESLSTLLGSNIGEDSLYSIFSRMCIGK